MTSMKLRTIMKPSADSVAACASHVVGTEGAAGAPPVEPAYSESRTYRRRKVPFTSENVLKVVARETGLKESDLEIEWYRELKVFEVRAIGRSDLNVWVLKDRAGVRREARERILVSMSEGLDELLGSYGDDLVLKALLMVANLSDLRPWITYETRRSANGYRWRSAKLFWNSWRACGLRMPRGGGSRKPSSKEYQQLQWAMVERDIDEIMADRKEIVDYLTEEEREPENMCWTLFHQCRFDRDSLVNGLMEVAGGPEAMLGIRETREGFMMERCPCVRLRMREA